MYCIARTHIFNSIPPDIKNVLRLRNGIRYDESSLGLEQCDSEIGAHIRGVQALLWPGSNLGNVRTFWIYFEVAFCLQTSGQILIRQHEMHILRHMCYDLNIPIKVAESHVNLPEGQPIPLSAVTAICKVPSHHAFQFSFLAALWYLYAGRVSPIGHSGILRLKRRHFKTLGEAVNIFLAKWAPPVCQACSVYQTFIDNAYSSPTFAADDWDTRLWRHAAVYNPWITRGRFDDREAARVIDILSPSGTRITVRLFKIAFSHQSGPYTGMIGKPFVDAMRSMNLQADVAGTVDYDDLSAALSMLDIGDGNGSSPPWVIHAISLFERLDTGEMVIRVSLAWARHTSANSPVKATSSANTPTAPIFAHYMLHMPSPDQNDDSHSSLFDDTLIRRANMVVQNRDLFDWLSITTMKLVDTSDMLHELDLLLADNVTDVIPGNDILKYWPKSGDETDLEAKLTLACTGVCKTEIPKVGYQREKYSVHGLTTVRRSNWSLLKCCPRATGGVDLSDEIEVIRGIFPTITIAFSSLIFVASIAYLIIATEIRGVEFEDAIQACLAVAAFVLTPYLTVLHSRIYGSWSVVGSLAGVMTSRDCINKDVFKCLAGRWAELKEMLLLQKRGGLRNYYNTYEGSFVGSPSGIAELQYTFNLNDVSELVQYGYTLLGTLCIRIEGLHDGWKTTSFDPLCGFQVDSRQESVGFVKECRVEGNIGRHRFR